jgi:hypothetical protein
VRAAISGAWRLCVADLPRRNVSEGADASLAGNDVERERVGCRYTYEEVLDGFEHVERDETGEGVHERYLVLAEALEREAAA